MTARTLDEALAIAEARRQLPSPKLRRLLRLRAGVSQQVVADELGVSRVSVLRYELGQRTPRGDALLRYVALLDRLGEEEPP